MRCIRSLSLLPVRRSLVGSFEESLLSGRYSCGKDNQSIDGFLAILNVAGGNFSPPTQKLPFTVSSIDEDSSLLYYSSINLVGRLPTNNSKSPKSKRGPGCEQRQNCYTTDESEKGGFVNMACCSTECDARKPTGSTPLGNLENGTNVDGCCCQIHTCQLGEKKSCCRSSKVNDSSAGRFLRYALHLRFLSPFSKKSRSRQQCKSDMSKLESHNSETQEERRFYLYNDIRVVFPQRHSDSDEGELRVEHDFPEDPKYFDISN
ncbi:hypothetical protein PR202_gb27551 [Eleusine coracana subsp. coracana]|uniref:Atos-like conserved domain-containing protein n=1 Tax=Eleusine coracana subsp. coracana TaxID=191504 RepID=A0AAV5FRZ6_ELECO|nr:hypothetical protein PR202_gb27551 [Eleusine coracana subsp. coracana]